MLRNHLMPLLVCLLMFAACGNSKNDTAATDEAAATNKTGANGAKKNILFFGTSLTAGYGLDPAEAYPALIQNRIDSLKLPYKVINGGLSGETTAGGKGRIDWLLKQKIDVFVLELGANDALRGTSIKEAEKNLQFIIDEVKKKYPDAKMVMVGMQAPPNLGRTYTDEFKALFPALANKNKMLLVPFLLDNVGGVPKLNQPDGIHPTAEGAKILAENVWVKLKEIL